MYLCILDKDGAIRLQRNIRTKPDLFLKAIEPFREDIVICVECMFSWYWLADLCARQNIPFVLGHALYMGAIHGGKSKNDKIDSRKIAGILRGGMLPMAFVYPKKMRATRNLLRRRNHLMRKRAELLAHIQNTAKQYNLPDSNKRGKKLMNRLTARYGKGKALSVLSHKLGRTVYYILTNRKGFDMDKFMTT